MGTSSQTRRLDVFRYIRLVMHTYQPQQDGISQPERGTDPVRVEGLAPLRGFVSVGAGATLGEVWDVAMVSELAGVLGVLQPPDIVRVRRGVGAEADPVGWAAAERCGVVHLVRGREIATLDLLRNAAGHAAIRVRDGRVWEFDARVLEGIEIDWWRRGWSPDRAPPGARLQPSGSAARLTLDAATVRRVFRTNLPLLSRLVGRETWHVRLPRSHVRSSPAGVVVWISPTPDGRLPPAYEPVLDSLGLIAIGADASGNERPLTDRLQLALDGIETVRRGWLIDSSRLYVSGFSGGGRCAAVLQLGLPDLFSGAVPLGGVDSYHDAPTGQGTSFWPARLGKPLAPGLRSLRDRRIGVLVGELDVNRAEAAARVGLLVGDGIPARLEILPGLGHALPAPSQFVEALQWVDEPSREARRTAAERARAMLGEISPDKPDRAPLIEVVRTAPWSDSAWAAAARLGYPLERFLSGSP